MTVNLSCICGRIQMTAPFAPEEVTDCNCSICYPYGVLWAYYDPANINYPEASLTEVYKRQTPTIEFHRCRSCGCIVFWKPIPPRAGRMGLNARLMDRDTLASARRRYLDGAITEKYIDE